MMASVEEFNATSVQVALDAPLLSIVVVAYQSAETLGSLWASLRPELSGIASGELFLIDNASTDGSVGKLQALAAQAERVLGSGWQLRVVANRENVGFARACNQALGSAQGCYFLLLN